MLALASVCAVLATLQQDLFALLQKQGFPASAEETSALAFADVDADGDLDLFLGNGSRAGGVVRLYLNDGGWRFVDVTANSMPALVGQTWTFATADVDRDGDVDLFVGNVGQSRLYLNDAAGSFLDVTSARLPQASAPTTGVVLEDFDGDGDVDAVLANARTQNLLYLNDGSGFFSDVTASHMPVAAWEASAAAAGDVDGDGDLDLVFANYSCFPAERNELYLNDGVGRFTDATLTNMPADVDATMCVSLSDIDADADLDLVFGNYVGQDRVYVNDGSGVYRDETSQRLPTDSAGSWAIAFGDVDNDGDGDLIIGRDFRNVIYVNDGGGVFVTAAVQLPSRTGPSFTSTVILGDIDGDRDLDCVYGGIHGSWLLINDGRGQYSDMLQPRLANPLPSFPVALSFRDAPVTLLDVDRDGDEDAAFLTRWGCLLFVNDGNGCFGDVTESQMPVLASGLRTMGVGDVEGDGDPDIVFVDGLRVGTYENNGRGVFSENPSWSFVSGMVPWSLVAGDLDGDGDADVVLGGKNEIELWLSDGAGAFLFAGQHRFTGGVAADLALGDLDLDGDPDLVLGVNGNRGYLNPAQNRIYLNNGTAVFVDATSARIPQLDDDTSGVAIADVDGDGAKDIVCANLGGSPQDRLYLNDGAGFFSDVTSSALPPIQMASYEVVVADVDSDGDRDLVFVGIEGDPLRIYLNDGSTRFADAGPRAFPAGVLGANSVAAADVDGDGDEDLLTSAHLLVNMQRQLDAPYLLRSGQPYLLETHSRSGLPAVSVAMLSTLRASYPFGAAGTLGLAPGSIFVLPPLLMQPQTGFASHRVMVPGDPSLSGVPLHAQAILIPLFMPPELTSVVSDRVLR